ncbi:MAG TPA: hypothetical protein VEU08_05150, partial [Vicinamibacterales bacterium]|nr:hypothetical protein [Vicinamibacterales bacterium]
MTIVEQVFRGDARSGFRGDTITLGWGERTRVHGRRMSDGGVAFATSLPRGTVLHEGDAFVLEDERVVVTVRE